MLVNYYEQRVLQLIAVGHALSFAFGETALAYLDSRPTRNGKPLVNADRHAAFWQQFPDRLARPGVAVGSDDACAGAVHGPRARVQHGHARERGCGCARRAGPRRALFRLGTYAAFAQANRTGSSGWVQPASCGVVQGTGCF